MAEEPHEGVTAKGARWLFGQEANTIILVAVLGSIGYWMMYEHPKVVQKMEDRYEKVIEDSDKRHKETSEIMNKNHLEALKMIADRVDSRESLLREFLEKKAEK